ncbi:MAG TPA: hypothetical protein VMF53_15985 [Alphaproteobacteria bacterium]|nr:hypothetical protein [Alphaproteobacteria bacterium]
MGAHNFIERLLGSYIHNVGLAALIVSAGALILLASRDMFEVDSRLRNYRDPVGATKSMWEWRYMSDFAQDCRSELLVLVDLLRLVLVVMIGFSVLFFFAEGIFGLIDFATTYFSGSGFCGEIPFSHFICGVLFTGIERIVDWSKVNPNVELMVHDGLGILVIAFIPFFMFRMARVIYNLVRARHDHTNNKHPWW